jgi:hypothetical protein
MRRACPIAALVALACNVELSHEPTDGDPDADDRPVARAATPPPPITGGTLLVTADGSLAIASDPDRDVVHIVDLVAMRERATIALAAGARPFRAAEDDAGRIHVTLRGTGQLATIDPHEGRVIAQTGVCPNPRGVAHDPERDAIVVACAGGELVVLAADDRSELDRRSLATDLRDVFVDRGSIYVSRFRTAEVLEVREADVVQDAAPISPNVSGILRTPGTAWRTIGRAGGGWVMLHQLANNSPLDAPPPGFGEDVGFGDDRGTPYGGTVECGGASHPGITAVLDDGTIVGSGPIEGIALAVDVALSPDGGTLAIASPSQHEGFRPDSKPLSLTLHRLHDFRASDRCNEPEDPVATDDFVAVAYHPDGRLLALTRDPTLHVFGAADEAIALVGELIVDTGHDLFHLDAKNGIACASCHPEGGDDGRVWSFVAQGPRRTQPLDAGIAGTAPFHWRGDMVDFATLVHEVRDRRMGGAKLSDERVAALSDWVLAIPRPNPERAAVDAQASDGAQLFAALGCQSCHAGASFTSNADADFGSGMLQIPNLHGVATRPPHMHDGRCTTLRCATMDMLAATHEGATDDAQIDALVAYLESI